MKMFKPALAVIAMISVVPAVAEPIGKWWGAFAQGGYEYSIRNDSAGGDRVFIGCSETFTYVAFKVGGVEPKENSTIIVTIDADEFVLEAGENGYVETGSHVASDDFHMLWNAMRQGQFMRVRLSTGQSTPFILKGAAKVLPKKSCITDFER